MPTRGVAHPYVDWTSDEDAPGRRRGHIDCPRCGTHTPFDGPGDHDGVRALARHLARHNSKAAPC